MLKVNVKICFCFFQTRATHAWICTGTNTLDNNQREQKKMLQAAECLNCEVKKLVLSLTDQPCNLLQAWIENSSLHMISLFWFDKPKMINACVIYHFTFRKRAVSLDLPSMRFHVKLNEKLNLIQASMLFG